MKEILKQSLIQTERLSLHAFRPADIPGLVELLQNPDICKTFMVPHFQSDREYTVLAERLAALSSPEDTRHLEYGIFLGDALIGFINDCGYDETSIELGYVVHPAYWGKGYATEALGAVLEDCRRMGFTAVTAGFFEENPASSRVMEKCGMVLTGRTGNEEYRGKSHKCLYREIRFQ